MNLLAHALLSGPGTEIRLGNLLADFVKGRERKAMPPTFLEGVRQHQAVDAFTDLHPLFAQSKARIRGYPYVSGILVDVFYDHFLSLRWNELADEPIGEFTARLYAELRQHPLTLPTNAQTMLGRIIEHDLLGSYGTIDGIERTLHRLGNYLKHRFDRDFGLAGATQVMLANFDGLDADFTTFFPLLQAHAKSFGIETTRRAG